MSEILTESSAQAKRSCATRCTARQPLGALAAASQVQMTSRKKPRSAPFLEQYCPTDGCSYYFRTAAERSRHYDTTPAHRPVTAHAAGDDGDISNPAFAAAQQAGSSDSSQVATTVEEDKKSSTEGSQQLRLSLSPRSENASQATAAMLQRLSESPIDDVEQQRLSEDDQAGAAARAHGMSLRATAASAKKATQGSFQTQVSERKQSQLGASEPESVAEPESRSLLGAEAPEGADAPSQQQPDSPEASSKPRREKKEKEGKHSGHIKCPGLGPCQLCPCVSVRAQARWPRPHCQHPQ